MPVQKPWDEYEVALLIEAYWIIRNEPQRKREILLGLSEKLRKRAKNLGYEIDDVFRNLNGMIWQERRIDKAFNADRYDHREPSAMFQKMAEMYQKQPERFERMLMTANEQVNGKAGTDPAQQTITSFSEWLQENYGRKYSAASIIKALEEASLFAISRNLSKKKLTEIDDPVAFSHIMKAMIGNRFFRLTQTATAKLLDKVAPVYSRYLKETAAFIQDRSVNTAGKKDMQEQVQIEVSVRSESHSESPAMNQDTNEDSKKTDDFTSVSTDAPQTKLYQCLFAVSKVYDNPSGLSLDEIISLLGKDNSKQEIARILDDVPWAVKISDQVYSFSQRPEFLRDTSPVDDSAKYTTVTITDPVKMPVADLALDKTEPTDFDKEKFEQTLLRRYRNGMQFDSIDFDNFREMYEMLFDETIPFDDVELEKRLRYCGIVYKDRLFPAEGILDEETKEKLFSYIDNCFSSGKNVLYYKAIFEDLADVFASCFTLSDEKMLRAYIEFTAEKGKYYFTEKYLSVEQDVTIDPNAEVANCLLTAGKPMTIEAVASALSHIPQEQVQSIIYFDNRFLCNFRGRNNQSEFFHEEIFEVSDEELAAIAGIIKSYIDENEYAIWTDVWNQIKEKMPVFLENNLYLSWLGVRNAIATLLSSQFNFNASVISLPEKRYEMKDIFQLYAKHHPTFSADDIYLLSKELDIPVALYLEALAEITVRVSYDLFVSKELISFDVKAIDKAIDSFMAKEYICLQEIDSFLVFPNVGYEWNAYLLESYVLSYSKEFMLLNNGMALNNAPGAIVKRGSAFTEFVDVCAAVLADSDVELKKESTLAYLAERNLITRRRYKDIELAIQKARYIRAGKR